MGERFSTFAAGVASGTDKTLINLFNNASTPTRRGKLYDFLLSSVATPADQAVKLSLGRTTAQGTAGASFTPNNLDSAGPAGEYSAGTAHSSEPTYTSNKELLVVSMNQRATFRWVAAPGGELVMPATQNAGIGSKSKSSTSTQAHELTVFHEE